MEQPTPTFQKLISRDRNFQYAFFFTVAPIVVLLYTSIMTGDLFPFRLDGQKVFLFGASIFGILWLGYQYNLITTTFRDGMTVKGSIVRTERKTTRKRKRGTSSTYYAVVTYSVNNEALEKRIKLPGPPEKYGLVKDITLDLILREEKPKTVFIKQIYLD